LLRTIGSAGRLRALSGIAAAVVLFEIILRQMYFGIPTWKPEAGWGYYGTELRRYYFEGGSTSRWDSRGVRGIGGPSPSGPPILAVGDSMTQATQVADDQTFTALLQRQIGLPVLNVGRDAQALEEDIVAAPYNIRQFQPVWTIVQFIPLDFEESSPHDGRPRFRLSGGQLEIEPTVVRDKRFTPFIRTLRKKSALVNLGLQRFAVLRDTPMPPLFRAADVRPVVPRSYGPIELELHALRSAYQGRVTMFLTPDFLPPPTDMERRFTAWCASERVSCVNLREIFEDFRVRGRAPTGFANSNFGFGHLNPEGHAAAARLLAKEIERLRAHGVF
jgi:hypothetical protein